MVGASRSFVYSVIEQILTRSSGGFERELQFGGFYILTFADLLEIRNVHAFNEAGVRMRILKGTVRHARQRFNTEYPFSNRRFMTDGAEVFAETAIGLEDISEHSQLAFENVVTPSLFEPVDYESDDPIRWYPANEWGLGIETKAVCLDPAYAFGAPIITEYRVRTQTLRDSYIAEGGDLCAAATAYDVTVDAVKCALQFEEEKERRRSLVIT